MIPASEAIVPRKGARGCRDDRGGILDDRCRCGNTPRAPSRPEGEATPPLERMRGGLERLVHGRTQTPRGIGSGKAAEPAASNRDRHPEGPPCMVP